MVEGGTVILYLARDCNGVTAPYGSGIKLVLLVLFLISPIPACIDFDIVFCVNNNGEKGFIVLR